MRLGEWRGQEHGVGDWQAVHTRAICTTTIMGEGERGRGGPTAGRPGSRFHRAKTHVRGSRSWSVVRLEETARIPPSFSPRIGGWFFESGKRDANTFKNAVTPVTIQLFRISSSSHFIKNHCVIESLAP